MTEQQRRDETPDGIRDDHADIEDALPSKSIQGSTDARRKLENYWARKELDEQLRGLDDWDDDSNSATG